jgi:hypothetical protein
MRMKHLFAAALVLVFTVCSPVFSQQAPTGKVVLTIKGKIEEKNRANTFVLDMEAIEKLPQQTFSTLTPWDKKPIKFTGPLLRDVLALVKPTGTKIKAIALNDYQTTIPVADATQFNVIMAYKMNDETIPIKTKGPLFIVYPYDQHEELQSTVYYERSAWQLKTLIIE